MANWKISAEMEPNYDGGLVRSKWLKGGVRIVKTKAERNAIPFLYRYFDSFETTLCFVESESKLYKLNSNPTGLTTDSNWTAVVLNGVSSFIPVGTWDSDNTSPVLQDVDASGRNGEFYFVVNTPTPTNVTHSGLFGGATVNVVDANMVVSVGSVWVVVANNVTWDSIAKPTVIDEYVSGIVIAHSHTTDDITDLATYLSDYLQRSDTADHTIDFNTVPDTDIIELEFLKQHYYHKDDLYTAAEIDTIIGGLPSPAVSFLDLIDSPSSYSSQGLRSVRVNAAETGLEFYTTGIAGTGDMVLALAQTNTGAKTFENNTLLLRNVADTFNGSFTNVNTENRVYILPDANGTIALLSDIVSGSGDMLLNTAQTVTAAKTFNAGTFFINNATNTFRYSILGNNIIADRTIALPLLTGNDQFAAVAATQTFQNKTHTSPVINTGISGSVTSGGNITSSNYLIGATATQTLTNKTLTSPIFTTPTLGTPVSGTLTNATGLPLLTGVTGILPIANGGTGTATPTLAPGTNISITGTWPNQTINSTYSAPATAWGTITGTLSSQTDLQTALDARWPLSGGTITLTGDVNVERAGTGTNLSTLQLSQGSKWSRLYTVVDGSPNLITMVAAQQNHAALYAGENEGTFPYSRITVAPTGIAQVESSFAGFAGLQYNANYSANFTNRSLVDKGYVDINAWSLVGNTVGSVQKIGTLDNFDLRLIRNNIQSGLFQPTNTLLGVESGSVNSGVNNTFVGTYSGYANSTGSNNTYIGSNAGESMSSGSNNVIIGRASGAVSNTASNQLSIQNIIYGVSNSGTGSTPSTGNIGIGVQAPTARFHLPAGTATAGTAPLKFTTGTALTTPSDGAMEYHSSHLYFTIGSTRYQLDQQGGGGSVATDTIWDGIGDLVVGTGSNTAARLSIGAANMQLVSNGGAPVWSYNILQRTQTGSTYTIQNSDLGYEIIFTNSTGCVVTIPNTLSVDSFWFSATKGTAMTSGDLSFVADSTTLNTIDSELTISEVSGSATWRRVAATSAWYGAGAFGTGGGGGISNTAAANELAKSDGTDIGPSGIFSTTDGNVLLGAAAGSGTDRTVTSQGSSGSIGLQLYSKGTGGEIGLNSGSNIRAIAGSSSTIYLAFGSSSTSLAISSSAITQINESLTAFTISAGAKSSSSSAGDGRGLILEAGDAYDGSGDGDGGNVLIQSGLRRVAGSGVDGNITLDALTGYLILANIPTSSAGLPTGAVWNNLGILTIA